MGLIWLLLSLSSYLASPAKSALLWGPNSTQVSVPITGYCIELTFHSSFFSLQRSLTREGGWGLLLWSRTSPRDAQGSQVWWLSQEALLKLSGDNVAYGRVQPGPSSRMMTLLSIFFTLQILAHGTGFKLLPSAVKFAFLKHIFKKCSIC